MSTVAVGQTSDGYHTFDELYDHRITLFLALCRKIASNAHGGEWMVEMPWRTETHSDGSTFSGWFVLGIGTKPGEQITYHLPMSRWDEADFADTLSMAPMWDGHTSADVLERLKRL